MVRQSTELEVNMNAVERVIEYTKLTPEKPPVIEHHRPPQGWPSKGVIEAQDLVVRYRGPGPCAEAHQFQDTAE